MDSEPTRANLFTPIHAALWMIGALLAMIFLLMLVSQGRPQFFEDQVTVGALSAVGFLLVSARLLSRYPGGASLRDALGARPVNPLLVLLGLIMGMAAQAPADALRAKIERYLQTPEEATQVGILLESHSHTQSFALMIVLAGLVPFAEEAFFRGAVYGALRRSRSSVFQAGLITGLGFALSHANLPLLLPIALVATLLALVRGLSGSLYPAIAAHMAFNAVPVMSVAVPRLHVDALLQRHVWTASAALLCSLALFVALARRSRMALSGVAQEALPYFPPLEEDA